MYDEETGLYYLKSRYYNASLSRFESPDVFVVTRGTIPNCNIYRYCNNTPCRYVDNTGYDLEETCVDDNPKDDLMPDGGGMVQSPSQHALQNGSSFKSQGQFRGKYGSAGKGMNWHHIVEQWQAKFGRFANELIYNTYNTIRLPTDVHQEISRYYSSKHSFTGDLTFRQWVAQFPYDVQFSHGVSVMNQVIREKCK